MFYYIGETGVVVYRGKLLQMNFAKTQHTYGVHNDKSWLEVHQQIHCPTLMEPPATKVGRKSTSRHPVQHLWSPQRQKLVGSPPADTLSNTYGVPSDKSWLEVYQQTHCPTLMESPATKVGWKSTSRHTVQHLWRPQRQKLVGSPPADTLSNTYGVHSDKSWLEVYQQTHCPTLMESPATKVGWKSTSRHTVQHLWSPQRQKLVGSPPADTLSNTYGVHSDKSWLEVHQQTHCPTLMESTATKVGRKSTSRHTVQHLWSPQRQKLVGSPPADTLSNTYGVPSDKSWLEVYQQTHCPTLMESPATKVGWKSTSRHTVQHLWSPQRQKLVGSPPADTLSNTYGVHSDKSW